MFYRLPSHLYHAYAALLGGDEYDLYHDPPLGRIYRLGLLFLVLVIQNTYTANLAAFLTASPVRVLGPKTMQQLKSAKVCLRWDTMYNSVVESFVGEVVVPDPKVVPYEIAARDAWGREQIV